MALWSKLEKEWASRDDHYLLAPIAWVYDLVVSFRNKLYDHELLPIHRVGVPVVSVGNITLGGGGKTPFVIELADALSEVQVGIVSRGYRSWGEKLVKPMLLSRGEGPLFDASICGDEPALLATKTKAIVVVGRDRVEAAKLAVAQGAKVIIVDDGMQHRRLHRDVNVVVVSDSIAWDHLFPRGKLREPLSGLARADAIVVRNKSLIDEVDRRTKGDVFAMELRADGERLDKKVGLFCGIAKPNSFVQTVEGLGGQIVDRLILPDHKTPTAKQLQSLANESVRRGAGALVCTEKDAVKLGNLDLPLPVRPIGVRLHSLKNDKGWRLLLVSCKNFIDAAAIQK